MFKKNLIDILPKYIYFLFLFHALLIVLVVADILLVLGTKKYNIINSSHLG